MNNEKLILENQTTIMRALQQILMHMPISNTTPMLHIQQQLNNLTEQADITLWRTQALGG